MKLGIEEIINAIGGRLLNDSNLNAVVTSISIDSRKVKQGALFVSITGENFDGHDFILKASENGAICVLTERQNHITDMDIPLIYVSSTRRALLDLANYYRMKHNVKVVAVTGSAGKTTTKDMIAEILSQKYKTKRTIGNFNNDIGMPLSIFQLEPDDEIIVLEMGMNHANEIHELSLTAAPDIAVITHIGDAHIENFDNREGILRAKLEIADGLRESGMLVLNGDDPLLTSPIVTAKIRCKTLYPNNKNIIEAEQLDSHKTRCHFEWRDNHIFLTVPIPGKHMVKNALLATVVGIETGVSPSQIKAAFEKFTPPDGRLNIYKANNITVFDDVYNANPASMLEAIKVLCFKTPENEKNRRVAVLGDMNELGHVAEARHREVGMFAATAGIDLLITIGKLSQYIYEAFNNAEKSLHFDTIDDLSLSKILQPNDMVLLKASRAMSFEKLIQEIK